MALSGAERAGLVSVFEKIKPKYQKIGGEAMDSLFKDHPDLKSHFSHMDVTPGSQDLKNHGGMIMDAINDALKDYDKIHEHFAELRDLHTTKLKLSSDTITLMNPYLVMAIVKHCSTMDRSACEKFLREIANNMNEA